MSKINIAIHLGQKTHDKEFATRNCLAKVTHDAEHVIMGDYTPVKCDLCNWRGRVSGLAVHKAIASGG